MVLNVFHIFPLSLQQDCETERGYTVWFQRSHSLYSASQRILNNKHCIVITDFSWLSLPLTTSILRSKNRGLTYLCTHSTTLNEWVSWLIMALLYYNADVCTLSPNASVILEPFGGLGREYIIWEVLLKWHTPASSDVYPWIPPSSGYSIRKPLLLMGVCHTAWVR